MSARQLALPFVHRSPFSVDGPIPSRSNETARALLAAGPTEWPSCRLCVWGPPGCGKTHLLHHWIGGRPGAVLVEAAAIPLLAEDGLLPGAALAIDDADQVAHETALLHVLNTAAERRVPLVLAARTSPARLRVTLPDLASRLRATLAAAIEPPEDDLLDALLARLLADRQLAVPPAVLRYMRQRLPREPEALREAAALLDHAALAGRRPVTLALAAHLFGAASHPLDTPSRFEEGSGRDRGAG